MGPCKPVFIRMIVPQKWPNSQETSAQYRSWKHGKNLKYMGNEEGKWERLRIEEWIEKSSGGPGVGLAGRGAGCWRKQEFGCNGAGWGTGTLGVLCKPALAHWTSQSFHILQCYLLSPYVSSIIKYITSVRTLLKSLAVLWAIKESVFKDNFWVLTLLCWVCSLREQLNKTFPASKTLSIGRFVTKSGESWDWCRAGDVGMSCEGQKGLERFGSHCGALHGTLDQTRGRKAGGTGIFMLEVGIF